MADHLFSDDLPINKYDLPEECAKHASKYFYWAQKLADAKSELNEKEDILKLRYSQIDLSIRDDWDEAKNGKMTEGKVKANIEDAKQYIAAKVAVSECQRSVNSLSASVSAMEHRRSELDNLTKLLIGGFYAAPNGGRKEGANEMAQREIRGKLNKKKKDGE